MKIHTHLPRQWKTFEYKSSRDFLINVLPLRAMLAMSNVDARVRNLRTNNLKSVREIWQACLFVHGIGSCVLGKEVFLAPVEKQDYDCIAQFIIDHTANYIPIQLKELVSEELNQSASLQTIIDGLAKYVNSKDLVVVIYLNRQFRLDVHSISIPKIDIAELWLYGACTPDASEFMLYGNMLKDPILYEYSYPVSLSCPPERN